MFDLSCITLAFSTAADAEGAFDTLTAEMLNWHVAGEYPNNADVASAIKAALPHLGAASVKVYASALLKWARAGKTPRTIRAMVTLCPPGHVKSKAGRKAGQGKSTSPEAPAAEAPQAPQGDRAWKQVLEAMRAGVPARKDWASEDIVAFQDCAAKMIALIARNAK